MHCLLCSLFAESCCLEYSLTLLRVTEPLEDRMEQALFSPPLSKQRVEYAVKHIKESCATSLVFKHFSSAIFSFFMLSWLYLLFISGWLWMWFWKFIGFFIKLSDHFGKNCWYWYFTEESKPCSKGLNRLWLLSFAYRACSCYIQKFSFKLWSLLG